MAQFEPLKDEIEGAGAQLAYIAAEKRGGFFKPATYLEKHPTSFPFLLDEDRTVTKAYGIYHRLGKDAINIAHPTTIVVDQSRTVRYVYRSANQADRAPIDQVMAALRGLGK